MSGDYSRQRFDPRVNYSGVLLQQGRVLLDADLNELVELLDRRLRAVVVDLTSAGPDHAIAGTAIVPRQTPDAFRITIDGKRNLMIGCGRLYVDGLLAENYGGGSGFDPVLAGACGTEDIGYYEQPYLPGARHLAGLYLPGDGRCHLVYLEAWQREVTAVEDPGLIEPAVGVETTARLQTVWQVRVFQGIPKDVVCTTPDGGIPGWTEVTRPSAGRLSVRAMGAAPTGEPNVVYPAAGYQGLENHLYRIEIHDGGGIGAATFKWSRDNASVAARVVAVDAPNQLRVHSRDGDPPSWFNVGDWIEIVDDWRELSGTEGDPTRRHGEMRRIDAAEQDGWLVTLHEDLPLEWQNLDAGEIAARNLRLRRWDQRGKVLDPSGNEFFDLDAASGGVIPVPPVGTPVMLEHGIGVEFSLQDAAGTFHSGDYWVAAARPSDASVEELTQAPPRGAHHHFARLAILKPDAKDAIDCRKLWPPECRDCGNSTGSEPNARHEADGGRRTFRHSSGLTRR